jgi:AcrR family transcriptional regulator
MQLKPVPEPEDHPPAPASSIFAPGRIDARATGELIAASQRQRLLYGVTSCVAERGYANTTIEAITNRAGVSKKTFYEHFENKLEGFLAAYDLGVEGMLAAIVTAAREAAAAGITDPVELVRLSLRGMLLFLVDEEPYARTFFVEVLPLGPEALRHRAAFHQVLIAEIRNFHERARARHPDWPEVPETAYEAVLTAIHGLITTYVADGRTRDLLKLEETIVYVQRALLQIPFG